MLHKIAQALYPVGHALGKAFGFNMFTPEEIKGMDIESDDGTGIPNFFTGTVYGVSFTHLVVGVGLGIVLAKALKMSKPVIRYRRKRRTTTRKRK